MNITEKVMSFLSKYFPEEIPEIKTTKKQANSTDEEIAVAIAEPSIAVSSGLHSGSTDITILLSVTSLR